MPKKKTAPRELAANTMLGDLLAAVVDEIKALPNVWAKLPENQQAQCIDRITLQLTTLIVRRIGLIASDGRPVIAATLESVQFKDGIKLVMHCDRQNPARHDLADTAGGPVLIVLANADSYLGGANQVRPDPDQHSWIDSPPGTPHPSRGNGSARA